MQLLLLGLGLFHASAHDGDHSPTQEPVQIYWTKVACVHDQGIPDCAAAGAGDISVADVPCDSDDPDDCVCADYWGRYPDAKDQDWIMAMAALFGIMMAFGIGANDAANSWATSVGGKAISVGYAVILCGFFEWAGATSIGYGVSKTIQKGVSKLTAPDCWACGSCDSSITLTMGGSLGALVGASMFLMFASGTAVPVSTTHSIVGGVVGMTMAGVGSQCLNWDVDGGLTGIILSWIVSPVLSGVIASFGYSLSLMFVIKQKNARWLALTSLPFMYGIITFACFMMIFLKAKAVKKKFSLNEKFIMAACVGVGVTLLSWLLVKPLVVASLPSENGTSELYLKDEEDEESPSGAGKANEAQIELADTATYRTTVSPRIVRSNSTHSNGGKPRISRSKSTDSNQNKIAIDVQAANPNTTPLLKWNVDTTIRWISSVNNSKYANLAQRWQKQAVDGECLAVVTDEELRVDLGVDKLGQRKTLMRAIELLRTRAIEKEAEDAVVVGGRIVDADNAEELDAIFVFRYLLVFTACMESFAHGSNDTANATGPFSAVYQLYTKGGDDCSSDEGTVWIMCIAGLFVALGVGTFGYRVIRTIGTNLTLIDFHKGYYIEIGSTLATMIATVMEMPVSTTHCQVGGVIGVGLVAWMRGKGQVSWGLFGKIFLTWVLTLPIAGGVAALVVMVIKGALIIPDA